MAIYRSVQMTFWTDTKIEDDFTPEDKYFYLYLFTNPHTNLAGCYEISLKLMAYETGYSKDTIERLLERFKDVHEVIDYCSETKEVLLLNWYKYNWTKSEKFRKPLKKEIEDIKNNSFREYLTKLFNGEDVRYRIDTKCIDTTVTVTVTDTVTDTVSVTDTVTDKKSNKNNKIFTPPTVEEVRSYCQERNNKVDPEGFIDFYESKGWFIGKNKMKDWKAAVRNWERSEHNKGSTYMDAIKNRVSQVDDW
jgi:hypothetical protein